jgi:hypothetical protein
MISILATYSRFIRKFVQSFVQSRIKNRLGRNLSCRQYGSNGRKWECEIFWA